MQPPMPSVIPILASLCLPTTAWAWGPTGHRVVGELAQRALGPEAIVQVEALLGPNGLAEVSTWADDIKSDPRWSCGYPLHYVTIPPDQAWTGPPSRGDAAVALTYFGDVLGDPSAPREARAAALKWIVHLMGDLHQPLHVGLGCDRGGNDVAVDWFREASNLHRVWDEHLVDGLHLSYSDLSGFLDDVSPAQRQAWTKPGLFQWFAEAQSHHAAMYATALPEFEGRPCVPCVSPETRAERRACRAPKQRPSLSWDYRFVARPIMEEQLRIGGVRLAAMLEHLLVDGQWPSTWTEDVARIRAVSEWDSAPKACLEQGISTAPTE